MNSFRLPLPHDTESCSQSDCIRSVRRPRGARAVKMPLVWVSSAVYIDVRVEVHEY